MSDREIALSPGEIEFIERMGINAETDGQARITGRIWGLLMVVGREVTSAEIAGMLKISRGSVSTNLRMLETLEIIERRSKPGERETYFAMSEHPYSALIRQFTKRYANHRKAVEVAGARMKRKGGRQNLANLAKFYEILECGHLRMLEELESDKP